MSYAEYGRTLDNVMKVELKREKDHKESNKIVQEHLGQLKT
ncbi:hypothetical protein [Alteribacter natronophilus]|nr:hypothetical protein [Alteribacter natronophilus]